MWAKIFKVVFVLLAIFGALVFLLIITLALGVFIGTHESADPEESTSAVQMQYSLTACGFPYGETASLDKEYRTPDYIPPEQGAQVAERQYSATASAQKMTSVNLRELLGTDQKNTSDWHRMDNLPVIPQNALSYYATYTRSRQSPPWLPDDSQFAMSDYYVNVSQLQYERGEIRHANICIFRPMDNYLYVIDLSSW